MSNTFFRDVTPEEQDQPDGPGPNEPGQEAEDLGEGAEDSDLAFVTEQKKPLNKGAVMMLAILVFGGAGTYMMYLRSGPKSASAAVNPAAAADAEVVRFLSEGGRNVSLMKQMLLGTERVVEQFNHYTEVSQVPLKDLKLNPFRFAPVKPVVAVDLEALAKAKREADRLAAIKAVQGLQLQSILRSHTAQQCMINNSLYSQGSQVEGFIIEKVNTDSVIVRNGLFRFELRMQK